MRLGDAAQIPVPRPGAPVRRRRGRSAPDRSGAGLVQEGEAVDGVCDEAGGDRRLREAAARVHGNAGQTDRRVRYSAQGGRPLGLPHAHGGDALAPASGQGGVALALRFLGANPNVAIHGERLGPGRVNYLLGNDPAKWHTGLRTYERVVYRNLWPGVDMVFHGQNGTLKYEFLVRPGARVSEIRLAYRGARRLSLDRQGDLRIRTSLGVLTDTRPVSYQLVAGKRVPVRASFALEPARRLRLRTRRRLRPPLPARHRPGPRLLHLPGRKRRSTHGYGIAVDGAGSAYVTGIYGLGRLPDDRGRLRHDLQRRLRRLRDEARRERRRPRLFDLPGRQRRPTTASASRSTAPATPT